jgi:hypothetical protein
VLKFDNYGAEGEKELEKSRYTLHSSPIPTVYTQVIFDYYVWVPHTLRPPKSPKLGDLRIIQSPPIWGVGGPSVITSALAQDVCTR